MYNITLKQYNIFNELENVCEVCGKKMEIEADICSDECGENWLKEFDKMLK